VGPDHLTTPNRDIDDAIVVEVAHGGAFEQVNRQDGASREGPIAAADEHDDRRALFVRPLKWVKQSRGRNERGATAPTLLAHTGASGGPRSGMVSQGWARDRTSHQGHGYPVASCGKPAQLPSRGS
jgi:hypothetical protein